VTVNRSGNGRVSLEDFMEYNSLPFSQAPLVLISSLFFSFGGKYCRGIQILVQSHFSPEIDDDMQAILEGPAQPTPVAPHFFALPRLCPC